MVAEYGDNWQMEAINVVACSALTKENKRRNEELKEEDGKRRENIFSVLQF